MPNVEINVVDNSNETACNIARQTYPDHIPAYSVRSMIDGIIARLALMRSERASDPVLIGRLRIVGHGEPGIQAIGNSQTTTNPRQLITVDPNNNLLNRQALLQLRGRFGPNAVVELHGCEVGRSRRGEALRRQLEALWGVQVRVSCVMQDPTTPGMEYLANH